MPSSVIHGMLYHPRQQMLDIVFRGGRGTWRYVNVTAAEWDAFRRAPSKGTYLNSVFKAAHPAGQRWSSADNTSDALNSSQHQGAPPRDLPDTRVWGFYD